MGLVGKRVQNKDNKLIGTVCSVTDKLIVVDYEFEKVSYPYPAAVGKVLLFEEETDEIKSIQAYAKKSLFNFKISQLIQAVNKEIIYLKMTGGKKYIIYDGKLIRELKDRTGFVYLFETDSELHFLNDTPIKIMLSETEKINATILSCEDFTITICMPIKFNGNIETMSFTAEQWILLEQLNERIQIINIDYSSIAYSLVADNNKSKRVKGIMRGQKQAEICSVNQPITFIWGPPGTGKTQTLTRIALNYINHGKKVLMVSYSNVSVDGAVLRLINMADKPVGTIVRYGYPRIDEISKSDSISSYNIAMSRKPLLVKRYNELQNIKKFEDDKKEIKKIDAEIIQIKDEIKSEEACIVEQALFVATTVSKASVDKLIYENRYDLVIFDEASMAYVSQVIFAASLARESFVCLGDFKQLPAIVQDNSNNFLMEDIFEYVGITSSVENGYGHDWLVMLDIQFRMHKNIADFSSQYMYGGLIKTSEKIYSSRNQIAECYPFENEAMGLVDLSDMYSTCVKTFDGSRINLLSAFFSMKIAESLSNEYEVGVITPYSAQSLLMLAIKRDLSKKIKKKDEAEKDEAEKENQDKGEVGIVCATVHQYQGSEKPVIIYDAVDCYRMPFPGSLLTSMKNNTADRLLNVAITRSQGKFITIVNKDYMVTKNIYKKNLLFTKLLKQMENGKNELKGFDALDMVENLTDEKSRLQFSEKEESWDSYLSDLAEAKSNIIIDLPGQMESDYEKIEKMAQILEDKKKKKVDIQIRVSESVMISNLLRPYMIVHEYAMIPITIIDKKTIWYGQPLSNANFKTSEGLIKTKYYPTVRFEGEKTARFLKAKLNIHYGRNSLGE